MSLEIVTCQLPSAAHRQGGDGGRGGVQLIGHVGVRPTLDLGAPQHELHPGRQVSERAPQQADVEPLVPTIGLDREGILRTVERQVVGRALARLAPPRPQALMPNASSQIALEAVDRSATPLDGGVRGREGLGDRVLGRLLITQHRSGQPTSTLDVTFEELFEHTRVAGSEAFEGADVGVVLVWGRRKPRGGREHFHRGQGAHPASHQRPTLLGGHDVLRSPIQPGRCARGTLGSTMTEASPRRGAPRRRRPPRRTGAGDSATSSAALTTTNLLPPVEPPTGFAALGVPERIDHGLAAAGFAQPFNIQLAAIPIALQGRDVCGRARTGSGKTLAFGVPMLARITDEAGPAEPLGLVLVPTRELAVQVAEVLEPVARHAGQSVLAVYGGANRQDQVDALRQGVELVVATPLRLIDLMKSEEIDLSSVQIVVLDEADRMADDGFTPQVEWVLRHCTGRTQTMLFSATLDGDVGHLVRQYMKDPVEVAIDAATDTVGTMHHLFLAVHHMDKPRMVAAIGRAIPKVAVFCQTKRLCDKVAGALQDLGVNAAAIHGDLPQPAASGRCAASPKASCRCSSPPTWPPAVSTSTTSARSSTTTRPRTPRTISTARAARLVPVATDGRSRSSSTTSTRRCASCSAPCGCRWSRRSRSSATTSGSLDLSVFLPDEA